MIVSHLSHFIEKKYVDIYIILRCNPMTLIKRLKKRGYDKKKIYDNVMFEALDGTTIEARDLGLKYLEIDNSKNPNKTVDKIINFINKKKIESGKIDYSRYILKIEKILN